MSLRKPQVCMLAPCTGFTAGFLQLLAGQWVCSLCFILVNCPTGPAPTQRSQRDWRECLGHWRPSGAHRHSDRCTHWLCSSSKTHQWKLQNLVHFQQMQPMFSTYWKKSKKSYPNWKQQIKIFLLTGNASGKLRAWNVDQEGLSHTSYVTCYLSLSAWLSSFVQWDNNGTHLIRLLYLKMSIFVKLATLSAWHMVSLSSVD